MLAVIKEYTKVVFVALNAMNIHNNQNKQKYNYMTMLESALGNKCKTFKVDRDFSENLTFHQLINTERSHSIRSSNIKISEQIFLYNDPTWKVAKIMGLLFRQLTINSILPKIEQLSQAFQYSEELKQD